MLPGTIVMWSVLMMPAATPAPEAMSASMAPGLSVVLPPPAVDDLEPLRRKIDEVRRRLRDAESRGAEGEAAELRAALHELELAAKQHAHAIEAKRADEAAMVRAQMGEIERAMHDARARLERARRDRNEGAVRELEVHLQQLEQKAARLHEAASQPKPSPAPRAEKATASQPQPRKSAEKELEEVRWRIQHMEQAEAQLREAGMPDMADMVRKHRAELVAKVEREAAMRREREQAREQQVIREREAASGGRDHPEISIERLEHLEVAVRELSGALRAMREEIEQLKRQIGEMRERR